ncbi:MAG TPA: hypothetical protein VJ596_09405 [Gemmatimonadaceae bacterium]|nr:hypothetical protein [Gemmatimonadaceae bacterium]
MFRSPPLTALAGGLCLCLTVSCAGERDTASDTATSSAGAAVGAEAPSASSADQVFAFTEADLDAYQRGLAREIELVRAAKERESTATTPEARSQATQAQWEDQTAPEAARSIGADADRYRRTRETVNRVFQTLDFQGKIDGPMQMDTTLASPEMRQRLTIDPFSELPTASAAALRARMDRLVPIWIEYVNLTAVAG